MKIKAYHYEFESAGTHTFTLADKPNVLLIKNFTDNFIYFSYGDEIDNEEYIMMKKDTAEVIEYTSNDVLENFKVTIEADGTGTVEIRPL